jgi:hypothetical protein
MGGGVRTLKATDAQRLHHALERVTGMLDHTTSRAVSAAWQTRWPDQYSYAVSLIRRSRALMAEMERHKIRDVRDAGE